MMVLVVRSGGAAAAAALRGAPGAASRGSFFFGRGASRCSCSWRAARRRRLARAGGERWQKINARVQSGAWRID